jgi:cob(I)alamin adenosyltransferase
MFPTTVITAELIVDEVSRRQNEDLKKILLNRAGHVEVILTGRYAPQELINLADLVTEMKEIKHYYQKGVAARVGIEK